MKENISFVHKKINNHYNIVLCVCVCVCVRWTYRTGEGLVDPIEHRLGPPITERYGTDDGTDGGSTGDQDLFRRSDTKGRE